MHKSIIASMGTASLLLNGPALAAEPSPWPAEGHTEAMRLTHLDADFRNNMSGASYNPETRTFWVCCNGDPSAFWALGLNESGDWSIQAKYDLGKGDLEGICQVDYRQKIVYLIDEADDRIKAYDVSDTDHAKPLQEWDASNYLPTEFPSGAEGITFVPDSWLRKSGFCDSDGKPYTSRNGMGGLMLIAHQNGGRIYAFDLSTSDNSLSFVGAYTTSRKESSGLQFDRTTGLLYIWHNTGRNYLEIVRLSSEVIDGERRFSSVAEFTGPRKGNLEGIAIASDAGGPRLFLMVDDDNENDEALLLYTRFDPVIPVSGDE